MDERDRLATQAFTAWDGVLTADELDRIEAHGDSLTEAKATLFDGGQGYEKARIRVTQTAWIEPNEDARWFYDRMQQVVRSINTATYQFDLTGFSENLQYTVYHGNQGGHYDWHVDQGPMKVRRKLSFSIQMSNPDDYEGGDLELRSGNKVETAPRKRGTVIAFPSYVLHRVTPVTAGTRKSIVLWTTGPKFR